MHSKLVVILALIMMFGFALPVSANKAPWPPDLSITPAENNIPAEVVPWLGKWVGYSSSGMGLRLAVEKIWRDEFGRIRVQTIYAWDDKYRPAGWVRQQGSYFGPPAVEKSEISFVNAYKDLPRSTVRCSLPTGDSLSCTWHLPRESGTASFKREK